MAYIQRGKTGKITAIFESAQSDDQEFVPVDSPELIDYIEQSANSNDARVALATSDDGLVRVLEDLVNTLIDNKVILFTDLPMAAREKLINREKIRGHLNTVDNLMDDAEGIL